MSFPLEHHFVEGSFDILRWIVWSFWFCFHFFRLPMLLVLCSCGYHLSWLLLKHLFVITMHLLLNQSSHINHSRVCYFSWKSILFDIRMATLACFLGPFACERLSIFHLGNCFPTFYSEIVSVFVTEVRFLYAAKCWVVFSYPVC